MALLGLGLMALTGWLLLAAPRAYAEASIEITGVQSHDLQHRFFSVDRDLELRVDAVGAALKSGDNLFAYPWLIDARTRALVWSMDEEITDPVSGSSWLREYGDDLLLRRGSYELYYYAGWPDFFSGGVKPENLGEVFQRLADLLGKAGRGGEDDALRALPPRYYVRLTGDAAALHETPRAVERPAAVSILGPGNGAYRQGGFTINADLDLEVYALGEYSESGDAMVDWGWVIDARTGKRVWEMTRDNTDLAGGAAKNRRFHDRVHLVRGDYMAYYVTDDSHTYDDWNSPPPYDPDAWGLQIFPVSPADRDQIVPYEDRGVSGPLLQLVDIGDNELRSQAFRLTRPEALRIYAIGEHDQYDDRMADYGWIVRAADKHKTWVMAPDNTGPAGGARKNRQFDGIVDLAAGDYILYYTSDGSHSYAGGWNASPPHDQKSYGVSLYATADVNRAAFVVIEKSKIQTPGVLAAITRVGNDEEREQRFTLRSPTRVRVHAVGEGLRSGMSDYGWIENVSTGDVVWEMTYRKTSHAGGAEKNRVVDQTILLDKGEYVVHYTTDDSHAYGDWNGTPPDDPEAWGITVAIADKAPN